MLVITRKKGESIIIGDNIEVKIIKIDDGSVKIAIDAPKEVVILRGELYKEVEEENKNAVVFEKSILKNIKK
ncbi:carbon storage regulator [Clostridium pasteurianum DSM 525 = ATCC 6013]|uniref:Translational regulator CsrA n=1 Tax=Clostridium pasteurianum DSM 525 = ATCC 6013 TaxID=1262449 RepID=A0A0H3J4I9_CLOPA|nr:carbon storage regulator CsrA [Clostridium pasteurianum]AJA47842.1 carbon storage regulator [Clostridium pasteurianum DSM 525 = ATCC 6013]AJA51830.1 carbon storage regulator [Clostridium pasteurianum DSM 525 = ATCC 6013]AOZ75133.1 carbon storage regulator [Clostridium pasteurianum DSM 525 = ATCC 6013]AOZ78928.1 carbon storage regulator [Clostridium pasteurianum]ELP59743.1 carbon storage regulator [Clostridium pasteurianum DSM 525 = ATCC 6013]